MIAASTLRQVGSTSRRTTCSKLAFRRGQFDPETVYATVTALAAGEIGSFSNLEPWTMLDETTQKIAGLGTRGRPTVWLRGTSRFKNATTWSLSNMPSDRAAEPAPLMGATLEEVWEDHCRQEFVEKDVAAALRTMTDTPVVNHVPVMTGGSGLAQVEDFYRDHFVGQSPVDFALEPVSRTVGTDRLVDEFICSFTHDIAMDWMLPGVAPTGRKVRLPVVAVIGFANGRIAFERVYWDQASLLVQTGLVDPTGLPVVGVEAAGKVQDPATPSNTLPVKHPRQGG